METPKNRIQDLKKKEYLIKPSDDNITCFMLPLTNRIQSLIEEKEEKDLTTFKPTLEFFKKIGIGRKRFQKIVRNEVSLTFQEMIMLSAYFDVSVWELHESTMSLAE